MVDTAIVGAVIIEDFRLRQLARFLEEGLERAMPALNDIEGGDLRLALVSLKAFSEDIIAHVVTPEHQYHASVVELNLSEGLEGQFTLAFSSHDALKVALLLIDDVSEADIDATWSNVYGEFGSVVANGVLEVAAKYMPAFSVSVPTYGEKISDEFFTRTGEAVTSRVILLGELSCVAERHYTVSGSLILTLSTNSFHALCESVGAKNTDL